MPRISPLSDPEFAGRVAQAFVDGCTREEMCHLFGVSRPQTITVWRRDPRVKVIAAKLIEDRVLQITRSVDKKIEAILHRDDLSVQEYLAIRKEYLGGALRMQTEKADDETIGEAQAWLEKNPDLADKFLESFIKSE
jgi:hypothetical protein